MFILNIHLLFLGFSSGTGQTMVDYQDALVSKMPPLPNQQTTSDVQDQDDLLLDPAIFLRKLDQKKLPPLDKQGRIIWSFKMSETNLFL